MESLVYAFALGSLASVLWLLSVAGHSFLVADLPYTMPVPGLAVPVTVHQWIAPALLLACGWVSRIRMPASPWRLLLSIVVIATLVLVWSVTLARHDRGLTLFHGALVFSSGWLALFKVGMARPVRVGLLGLLAIVLLVMSYGAIWGETRCEGGPPVGCLKQDGPRVLVPQILETVGIPAFADLRGADLRGARLRGRDLRYADLRSTDLRGADLSGSNLRRGLLDGIVARNSNWQSAYLDGASMVAADLAGANLNRVHAYLVDLRHADLANSRIRDASLSHALLEGARLEGADLSGTYLRFVDSLVDSQLASACGDGDTRLSAGFSIPFCARPDAD